MVVGCQLYAPAALTPSPQEMLLVFISVRGWVFPQGYSAIGRIMSMKNSTDASWDRTSDLLICSTVPKAQYWRKFLWIVWNEEEYKWLTVYKLWQLGLSRCSRGLWGVSCVVAVRLWAQQFFRVEREGGGGGWFFFNLLKAELNPICHLLALLGAHHILHVSRIRVKSG
jgi:hypothetical protein